MRRETLYLPLTHPDTLTRCRASTRIPWVDRGGNYRINYIHEYIPVPNFDGWVCLCALAQSPRPPPQLMKSKGHHQTHDMR